MFASCISKILSSNQRVFSTCRIRLTGDMKRRTHSHPCITSMLEAWYMDESSEDQRLPHKLDPNEALNADLYENDPELQKIREEKGYSYMDVIDVHPDKLPDYEEKLKTFYQEHLHLDDEIRYILDGRAYFDVRDKSDRWIRIAMLKGDMITLPAGIYHRFTMDETNYTKAMRLFVGEPVWKAYNRPADHFEIRKQYLDSLKCS